MAVQNLCEAKEEDFPKTSQCFKDEGTKIFNEKAVPPPMDCVSRALSKCNKRNLGHWKEHFMMDMMADPNVHKDLNAFVIGNDFFKNGCTGQ